MKQVKDNPIESADPSVSPELGARLGQQLVRMGKISEHDVARIVGAQKADGMLFGEAAVGLGLLTQDELQRALSEQYSYPYVEVSGSGLHRDLVAAHRPFSAEAEIFRGLRSQLNVRWFDDRHKTIALISPRAGEGTSTVAANLAICFAQLGERTLLIDANFRNPRQHDLFGCRNGGGLSSILTGRAHPRESLTLIAPFKCLSLLTTGPQPPNPQELLNRIAFSYLIETAPASFDIILIDSPPALDYADAQVISAAAAGVLLVTRRNRTKVCDIESAKNEILPTGAELVGTVINE